MRTDRLLLLGRRSDLRWYRPRWCRSRSMCGPLRRGGRVRAWGRGGSGGGHDGVGIVVGLRPLIVSCSVKALVPLDSCRECVGGDVGRRVVACRQVTIDFRGCCLEIGVGGVGCGGSFGELFGHFVELIVHRGEIDGGVGLHVGVHGTALSSYSSRGRRDGACCQARYSDLRW